MEQEEQKPFKILSIDGGGIKGIYSSTILEKFEEKFSCCISDHFDMLCGTSTGGLIALALSLKVPAKVISDLYLEKGEFIFNSNILSTLKQILWGGKYSNENLKICLKEIFGDKKIEESGNLLCIPAFNYTDSNTCVFKFDHKHGNLSRDNKLKYIDVALATSAAPTYFPLCHINDLCKQYIDGGLWANNPALVGVIEALCHFVGHTKAYDSIQILSISSLDPYNGNPIHSNLNRSLMRWGANIKDPFFDGQSHFANNTLRLLQDHSDININYVRIPSTSLSAKQKKQVGMDKVTKKCLEFMKGQGESQASLWYRKTEIENFFKKTKTYNTK